MLAAASPNASWTLDPGPIVIVLVLLAVYLPRWRTARRQDGARGAPVWRLLAFLGGVLALVVALLSPVDALGEQLFVMHMTQHLLLLDIVPILLILGLTKIIMRPVTRRLQRLEHAAGFLAGPIFAVCFYVAAMWVWHVPALYDLALEHPSVHVLEHTFFLSAGLLYWWHLLSPIPSRLRLTGMGPVVYMLATKLGVGILGIALTFAPDSLYDFYTHQPEYWGLSPTDDQRIGGALMAIEQSVIMGIALAWLFIRALSESDRNEERAERLADRAAAQEPGEPAQAGTGTDPAERDSLTPEQLKRVMDRR